MSSQGTKHPSCEKKIGVAIVGVGFGCVGHLPAFRTDPRFEVRALCASRLEHAKEKANLYHIPSASDRWEHLLERNDIHALSLAVPPDLQPTIARAAIRAGKHVFCEKPLALSLEEARILATEAEAASIAHMIDLQYPEIAAWRQAASLLQEGIIGPLRYLHVHWHVETRAYREGLETWKTDSRRGGGVLFNFASHTFGYLEDFAGTITRLHAWLRPSPRQPHRADTLFACELEFASGAAGTVALTCDAPQGSGHCLEIYGERGMLLLHNLRQRYTDGFVLEYGDREHLALQVLEAGHFAEDETAFGRIGPLARLVRRFGDWIVEGRRSSPHFGKGLRVQELIEAARQSHAKQAWINVEEVQQSRS